MTDTERPEAVDGTGPAQGADAAGASPPSHRRKRRSRSGDSSKKKAPPSVGRRISFWTGIGLIAAGVGLLGWVAWQFWGTNWQSQQRQDDVRSALSDGWSDGQDVVRTDFGNATAILHVPKFGKDWSVPVLEGSSDEVLAAGVGHMEDTGEAGAIGNYVLAGHRVTHGEPFADLPELVPGDEVIVETRVATYTYVLDTGGEDLIIPFTETWVLDDAPVNPRSGETQPPSDAGEALITLLTCSEIFHTDNRSVVFGHLVATSPAGG